MQVHLLLQNGSGHYQVTLPPPPKDPQGQYLTTSSSPLLLWIAQIILGEGLWPLFVCDHLPPGHVKERETHDHP